MAALARAYEKDDSTAAVYSHKQRNPFPICFIQDFFYRFYIMCRGKTEPIWLWLFFGLGAAIVQAAIPAVSFCKSRKEEKERRRR